MEQRINFRSKRNGGGRKNPPSLESLNARINKLARETTPEKKHIDNYNSGTVSNSASINYISNIGQGLTDNQRLGDEIKVLTIDLTAQVVAGDATNAIRVLVIRDVDTDGVAPTETELFETTSNPFSPINSAYTHRFKVLYDKLIGVATAGPDGLTFRARIKCPSLITEYINTGATDASAGTNAYWLIRQSDSGAATHPTCVVYTRLTYVDP